jgi:hypothetical protein
MHIEFRPHYIQAKDYCVRTLVQSLILECGNAGYHFFYGDVTITIGSPLCFALSLQTLFFWRRVGRK